MGQFYFDHAGVASFRNRQSRQIATSSLTVTDKRNFTGTELLYTSATTRRSLIQNQATVTANGLAAQTYKDAASAAAYMTWALSVSTGQLTTAEALALAQYLVNLKKDSFEVLESITIHPGTDTNVWQQILTFDINTRITVKRTPEGSSTPIVADYFIEGISLDWGPGPDAACTWRLSSAAKAAGGWLAGVVGRSEAGTTTKAGY
jgi:hypothetical protein